LPVFEKVIGDNPTYSIAFTVITFGSGIYYLLFSAMTERMKGALDDFRETLDKSSYYDIVNSVMIERRELGETFTRRQFENAIRHWLDFKACHVGETRARFDHRQGFN
jgi:hypothetical protein